MSKYIILVFIFQLLVAFIQGFLATRKKQILPLEKMAITAFIPVLGLIIPYLGFLFPKKEGEGDLIDVFDHNSEDIKNEIRYEKTIEIEKELNYIPVEEALLLNNSSVKRKLIMDTARDEAYDYISFLKLAMSDSDMETSHYAASIVMEINRKLQTLIQKAAADYEKNNTDAKILSDYVDIVGKYYKSGLLDEGNETRYGLLYSKLIEQLINLQYDTEALFKDKIETDIKLKEYTNLFHWIERYHDKHPESETPYLLAMKYYYITNNVNGINQVLHDVENSHVNFTREGNEIIKYWANESA